MGIQYLQNVDFFSTNISRSFKFFQTSKLKVNDKPIYQVSFNWNSIISKFFLNFSKKIMLAVRCEYFVLIYNGIYNYDCNFKWSWQLFNFIKLVLTIISMAWNPITPEIVIASLDGKVFLIDGKE